MWRMRQFLRHFRKFPYRKGVDRSLRYHIDRVGMSAKDFENWLLFNTGYARDWRTTILGIKPYLTGYMFSSDAEMGRAHRRTVAIKEAIKACSDKGYLDHPLPDRIRMTYKGRAFSNFWCVNFANEFLKEYGTLANFLVGGGIGAAITGAIWLYNNLNG